MPDDEDLKLQRQRIVDYLEQQIIGPANGFEEELNDIPINRYVMGILFPRGIDSESALADEEEADLSDASEQGSSDVPISLAFQRMPSSVGISFLISNAKTLDCNVTAATYSEESFVEKTRRKVWKRRSLSPDDGPLVITATIPAIRRTQQTNHECFGGRAQLNLTWRPHPEGWLVTATLMNTAKYSAIARPDPADCLYQVEISCKVQGGTFLPFTPFGLRSLDEEDEELALQYRKRKSFGVGHGCAARWHNVQDGVDYVASSFLPQYEVPSVVTERPVNDPFSAATDSSALKLTFLADEKVDTQDLRAELLAFARQYSNWIKCQSDTPNSLTESERQAFARILARLNEANNRIRNGIEFLTRNSTALSAFRKANKAMLMQMLHSGQAYGGSTVDKDERVFLSTDYASLTNEWRPFQLAFILMTVESVANDGSNDRDLVDLIWFPTGGGKTEAYLAIAAFAIFHKRLKYHDKGGGTTVFKRYTLRLLTSQQFQRAATLVCACEMIRRLDNGNSVGNEPITLGLWAGEGVSPNYYSAKDGHGAKELYEKMLEDSEPDNPFQLLRCPWCGTRIVPRFRAEDTSHYGIRAEARKFEFFCPSQGCPFHDRLPIKVVDEDMYDNPPSMIIGTIDKFAQLAWDHRARSFFSASRPPSLIIQDELHLISGPLGTLAGLYEAGIDSVIRSMGLAPKYIAATATIRRAREQVKCLYGRETRIFPPPGPDADDSFFSMVDTTSPGRLFIGVMGQAHTSLTSQVHVNAAMCQAPIELNLSQDMRDGYWTQIVYQLSRRELGKTMALARDDIPARVKVIAKDQSKMRDPAFVQELSANVSGQAIPGVLDLLSKGPESAASIDILPCTNMLSVGVDIKRLALMTIIGQPKTTAEYIQASSRIGRDKTPGLVVTLYRSTKPRDRSHYENFIAYHQALYRMVEPTSVTSFALPARERALHAALVILVRHAGGLSEQNAAADFDPQTGTIQRLIKILSKRIEMADEFEAKDSVEHLNQLASIWFRKATECKSNNKPLHYYSLSRKNISSLLCAFGDEMNGLWPTLRSMRHVDSECLIHVIGEKRT